MRVEISGSDILIDADILAPLLGVAAADVPALMRKNEITSKCERGIDAHEGQYRLSFFYQDRRARLMVDLTGRVLQRARQESGSTHPSQGP
ncbi:MAG: hypothetical protein JSR95_10740 [Proteobacteria bacterium]|nr:hypothetical protein [Pseudomonadota bacterium]